MISRNLKTSVPFRSAHSLLFICNCQNVVRPSETTSFGVNFADFWEGNEKYVLIRSTCGLKRILSSSTGSLNHFSVWLQQVTFYCHYQTGQIVCSDCNQYLENYTFRLHSQWNNKLFILLVYYLVLDCENYGVFSKCTSAKYF